MHPNILEHQRQINERLLKSYSNYEDLIKKSESQETVERESSDEDELEAILAFLEKGDNPEFQKSEDDEDDFDQDLFEKGVVQKVHKYLQKVGDKYFYAKEVQVKPINEHRDYLREKTSLDSIHGHVKNAPHSEENRESYKNYNKKKDDFKTKYGHDHNSDEAADKKKMTMHAMHNHINNRVKEIEDKQNLKKAGENLDIIKGKAFTIGQLDKSGRNVKTADGWKPVKTHGNLIKKDDKKSVEKEELKQKKESVLGNRFKFEKYEVFFEPYLWEGRNIIQVNGETSTGKSVSLLVAYKDGKFLTVKSNFSDADVSQTDPIVVPILAFIKSKL